MLINDTSSFIDHLYCCYFLYAHRKKNLRQVKEDMVPTLSLSLSLFLFLFSVMFSFDCYTHTYVHTRKEKRMKRQNNSMCMWMYVCARSLQFKPDGVYVLFFSLILVRANTNRRRLSAMYKPFIILAPVQQQLNAFFFSRFFVLN